MLRLTGDGIASKVRGAFRYIQRKDVPALLNETAGIIARRFAPECPVALPHLRTVRHHGKVPLQPPLLEIMSALTTSIPFTPVQIDSIARTSLVIEEVAARNNDG
jgi:hypothetical protein